MKRGFFVYDDTELTELQEEKRVTSNVFIPCSRKSKTDTKRYSYSSWKNQPSIPKMSMDQLKAEKVMTEHLENCESTTHKSNNDGPPLDNRKIVHKIDRRLVTALGLMFAVSLMDRTNLAAANIAGMAKELELDKGFRYVSFDSIHCL